jgi:membrane fusion protein (multidrug efflux system)
MHRVFLVAAPLASVVLAACGGDGAHPAPPQPPPVQVVAVRPERLELSSEWIATLDGSVNAEIRPQVSGYVVKQTYREGAAVRKGDVLFEIDARPFEAGVAMAEGQLAQAQAQLGKADRDVARDTPLAEARAIPQMQLDDDIQNRLTAQAARQSAAAALETATLNLGFTRVRSLVSGIAGIASAQVGDQVNPSTLLATVSQVDPILASFAMSEEEYLRIAGQLSRPPGRNGLWNTGPSLSLALADGTRYQRAGTFAAADREIDPTTGTIRVQAAFPNPDRVLRPGQYARVRAATAVVDDALLVPQRAVTELQDKTLVRIVGPDNKVEIRTVQLAGQSGNRWIVKSGLAAGARVIIDGPLLPPGTIVRPVPVGSTAVAMDLRGGS